MKKTRLFLDVDGVLITRYGGRMQMRPYVGTFLTWAVKNFDCYWMTAHRPESTYWIARFAGVSQLPLGDVDLEYFKDNARANEKPIGIHYAHWRGPDQYYDKLKAVMDNGGLEDPWLALEDEYPGLQGRQMLMDNHDLRRRWLICPRIGADVLLDVKHALEKILGGGRLDDWPWKPNVNHY